MKYSFLIALIAITLQSIAQSNTISWNKMMIGVIGNDSATMYLQKTGKTMQGYYYYNNKQVPVKLRNVDSETDSIFLNAYENGGEEHFEGTYNGGTLKGSWKEVKDDKTTSLPFSFTEYKLGTVPHFDVIYTEYSTKYPIGVEDDISPSYNYLSAALWPVTTTPEPLSTFLKKWINEIFGRKNTSEPIGKFFVSEKNKEAAIWKNSLKGTDRETIKADANGFSLSNENRLFLIYQSDTYLSFANFGYSFTGGVHGMYGTSMHVIDIKKRKILKLSDVFTLTGKQRLKLLLENAAREKFNIPKGQKLDIDHGGELLVVKVKPTENFYITGKGVGFTYVPYEIAAYSFGQIDLFIPYEKLKDLLQPGFKY